ncbi:hypothetical protein FB451DRAFT_1365163 [Mycena latifolia]|nr:hypothetical protein FB451DRAFT_1365163 [Mycena latifolia]
MLFSAALLISASLAGFVPSALGVPSPLPDTAVTVGSQGTATVTPAQVLDLVDPVISAMEDLKAFPEKMAAQNPDNPKLPALKSQVATILNSIAPGGTLGTGGGGLLGGLLGGGSGGALLQCLTGNGALLGPLLPTGTLGGLLANNPLDGLLGPLLSGGGLGALSGLLGGGDLLSGLLAGPGLVSALTSLLGSLGLYNNGCACQAGSALLGGLLVIVKNLVAAVAALLNAVDTPTTIVSGCLIVQ